MREYTRQCMEAYACVMTFKYMLCKFKSLSALVKYDSEPSETEGQRRTRPIIKARIRAESSGPVELRNSKHRIVIIGNAAWAFLRAKETLRKTPDAIAGLPVTITDDTLVEDLMQFCERVTRSANSPVKLSSWPLPFLLSYAVAWLLELLLGLGFIAKFQVRWDGGRYGGRLK
jgi:hypothetical protein